MQKPNDFVWLHPTLQGLGDIHRFSRHRIKLVSLGAHVSPARGLLNKPGLRQVRHVLCQIWLHLQLAFKVWRLPKNDLTIVLEFHAIHMHLAAPLLALSRTRLAFMMHGTQQLATRSWLRRVALDYFKMFPFTAIQQETSDDVLPPKLRIAPQKRLVLPLPILLVVEPRLSPGERLLRGQKIRIGVVGMLRPGKPAAQLLAALIPIIKHEFPECELHAGTPHWQRNEALEKLRIPITDTTEQDDYLQLLRQLDIVVCHYERADYFYRSSGTITDAASAGCHVVFTDLPVLRVQIDTPMRIGTTFSDFADLPRALREAIQHVREHGQDHQWAYREPRSAEAIARLLDDFIDSAKP